MTTNATMASAPAGRPDGPDAADNHPPGLPSISLTMGTPEPSTPSGASGASGANSRSCTPSGASSCCEALTPLGPDAEADEHRHLDADAFAAGLAPDRYIDDNDEVSPPFSSTHTYLFSNLPF